MKKSRVRKENEVHVLSVGQLCNNYCVMCYNPKYMRDNPSFEDLKKEIGGLDNPSEVYITGGEPTIRKDIFDIIKYIKKIFPRTNINLISNGRMFSYDSFSKKIGKLGLNKVITELHSSDPKIHDKITQANNSFNQTFKGILNLIDNNINVELRFVINKINYSNLPLLSKFVHKNISKLLNVTLFPINIIGDAYKNKNEVAPKYGDMKKYIEESIDILDDKFKVNLFHVPFCLIGEEYWKYTKGVTTSEIRLGFSKKCDECIKKDNCSGLWKTYLVNFGDSELKPIKS